MPIDSFVQVAPDSTGKQVDMSQVATAAGATIYRQRAEITDPVADAILQLNATLQLVLANERAILFALTQGDITEEQFLTQ